ncbi:hypothetical protein LAT59_01295 [Candidatus Gracilibacteria bacterium]|nr:hypothetical protein [Candidatus Gracilibacteria bacterium]
MSLEKLYSENERKEKNRKSLDDRERFLEEQQVLRQSSELLHTLAGKIAAEFGLDIGEVKEFIKGDTLEGLEGLKNTLGKNIDVKEFQKALKEARNTISELSKKYREHLKESILQNEDSPENFTYHVTEKYFSEYKRKALNPENFLDHVLGVGLGIVDTTEAVILFIYGLGKGILLTPYHLYLILSGKANIKDWKNI